VFLFCVIAAAVKSIGCNWTGAKSAYDVIRSVQQKILIP